METPDECSRFDPAVSERRQTGSQYLKRRDNECTNSRKKCKLDDDGNSLTGRFLLTDSKSLAFTR